MSDMAPEKTLVEEARRAVTGLRVGDSTVGEEEAADLLSRLSDRIEEQATYIADTDHELETLRGRADELEARLSDQQHALDGLTAASRSATKEWQRRLDAAQARLSELEAGLRRTAGAFHDLSDDPEHQGSQVFHRLHESIPQCQHYICRDARNLLETNP